MNPARPRLVLVANARMPSERAQSLQVAQMAAAFARAGAETALLHARRHPTPTLPDGQDLFDYYAVPEGARPSVDAVPCMDWIDRVPRRLQFVPARIQELTFARNAAARVRSRHAGATVLSREIETARALARKSAGGPVFLELHRVPGGRTRRRWLDEAARGVAGIVTISGGVRDDLVAEGVPEESIRVEHDAQEPARFAEFLDDGARARARAALGIAADARVVVYTGGLLDWKGVDILIEAARELPDVEFVIAGGMEADVARHRERAQGLANVRLDGFQAPGRVALYLAAGDLGVVPNRSTPAISARYTSPLKVFEALAAGLPLVVSDLPSLREILPGAADAVHVPPDDAHALARGIADLAGDAGRRAALRQRSLARAPELTWDARAERLLAWMAERGSQ